MVVSKTWAIVVCDYVSDFYLFLIKNGELYEAF